MKYAIHTNALSSVYQDSSEKSRQTSQLLFAELCVIKSDRENFYYVENFHDKHCGWALKSSFLSLSEDEAEGLKTENLLKVCMPLVDVFNLKDKTILRLPAGSIIPHYNTENNKFRLGDAEYQIHSSFISYLPHGSIDGILEVAMSLRNTPFMFGGKSVLGVDKSGLVQLMFSLCGYNLPRTAQDQVKVGIEVNSIEKLEKGDLVFIEQDNTIVDVMTYLQDGKVIGVNEKVKIMNIEEIDIGVSNTLIRRVV